MVFSPRAKPSAPEWMEKNLSVCLHFGQLCLQEWRSSLHQAQISSPKASTLGACSMQSKPKPPFCLTALNRPDSRGETSCSWWLLLGLHVIRSFSSHGTSFLAFCLVTLTVLSTRCCKTCHTPCWNWKAQCPPQTMCQSNSTAHTKRKGGSFDKTAGTHAGCDRSLTPCPIVHKAST